MAKMVKGLRIGDITNEQLAELKKIYGTETTAVTVAVDRLYHEAMQEDRRRELTERAIALLREVVKPILPHDPGWAIETKKEIAILLAEFGRLNEKKKGGEINASG